MKKNFFYLAMAACVAICNVSCGDDDDSSSSEPKKTDNVTLTTPRYEDKAVEISITPAVASTFEYSGANYEKLSDAEKNTLPKMTSVDLTEGGIAISFSDVQPQNAYSPIFSTPSGTVTEQSVLQREKALAGTIQVPSGMTMVSISENPSNQAPLASRTPEGIRRCFVAERGQATAVPSRRSTSHPSMVV